MDFHTNDDTENDATSRVFLLFLATSNGSQGRTVGVILSLQAFFPVYIGIDNLNVPNFVAKLLNETEWVQPLLLRKDGDLIACIQGILDKRGSCLRFKIVKVKGRATGGIGCYGLVRRQDKDADYGRRRQPEH